MKLLLISFLALITFHSSYGMDCNDYLLKDMEVVQATNFLLSGGSPNMLTTEVRIELAARGRAEVDQLNDEKVLLRILDWVDNGSNLDEAAGKQIRTAKLNLNLKEINKAAYDSKDVERSWGIELLHKEDKTFYEPEYLAKLVKQSNAVGSGDQVTDPNNAKEGFERMLSRLAPDVNVRAYTQTGSDANNLFYEVANEVASKRLGKSVTNAEVLFLDGTYGGARGKTVGMHKKYNFGRADRLEEFRITSPSTKHWDPIDPYEIARLEILEKKSLEEIEDKFLNSEKPIGGFLLEAIQGAEGVLYFRPEYISKLRKLCDKLRIPILADEILTGGGRTGKFFGYQHYEKFKPDYLTFGKGLQTAGIAAVNRKNIDYFKYLTPHFNYVTVSGNADSLLKGTQVLKRIYEDDLVKNAEEMGEYFRKKSLNAFGNAGIPIRGKGMLMYDEDYEILRIGMRSSSSRLMPPISITKDEIDAMFTVVRDRK